MSDVKSAENEVTDIMRYTAVPTDEVGFRIDPTGEWVRFEDVAPELQQLRAKRVPPSSNERMPYLLSTYRSEDRVIIQCENVERAEEALSRVMAWLRSPVEKAAPTVLNAEGSALMMELFNRMPVPALRDAVPAEVQKRIGDFMVANGYRFVFDRWYLQAEPKEPARRAENGPARQRCECGSSQVNPCGAPDCVNLPNPYDRPGVTRTAPP